MLAISHYMKGKNCYPSRVKDPSSIAQFYFENCAIEMNVEQLAVAAATLAGIGRCPITFRKCLRSSTVKLVLSTMYSSGMTNVRRFGCSSCHFNLIMIIMKLLLLI